MKDEKYCLNCGCLLDGQNQFCPVCGKAVSTDTSSAEAGMAKKCLNCGEPLEEDAVFCPSCGEKVSHALETDNKAAVAFNNAEKLNEKGWEIHRLDSFNTLKDSAVSSAKKVIMSAQGFAEKNRDKTEEAKTAHENKIKAELERQKEELAEKRKKLDDRSQQYMAKGELWSWLRQSSKRQHFYTEEIVTVTEKEYFNSVKEKLENNLVPAVIEKKYIRWDRGAAHRKDFVVRPLTELINPLSCLIQFDRIGKFVFVEERIFITPPDLPDPPLKKKPFDANYIEQMLRLICAGALLLVIGITMTRFSYMSLLGCLASIIGGGLLVFGFLYGSNTKKIMEYNKKCDEMEIAWEDAWNNWRESILAHSFQEDVNGQVSRIYDAVFECVKQVNEELFRTDSVTETVESNKLSEIEDIVTKRKQEYR